MTKEDAVKILGLSNKVNYTEDEIKKAYRTAMNQNHPDHGGNEEQAKKINEARSFLKKYYLQTFNNNVNKSYVNNSNTTNNYGDFKNYSDFWHYLQKMKELINFYQSIVIENNDSKWTENLSYQLKKSVFSDLDNKVSDNTVESLKILIRQNVMKTLLDYENDFCNIRGIVVSNLYDFGYKNPSLPVNVYKYVHNLISAYVDYQKDYIKDYVKKMDCYSDYRNQIDNVICNLPYDDCKPVLELVTIFNERLKRIFDTYYSIEDVKNLNLRIVEYISKLNKVLFDILINVKVDSKLKDEINNFKTKVIQIKKYYDNLPKDSVYLNDKYKNIIQLCQNELNNATILLKKCYDEKSVDKTTDDYDYSIIKLKKSLNIDLSKIKIPYLVVAFENLLDKIKREEIMSNEYLVECFLQIEQKFANEYGVTVDDLIKYGYKPIKQIDLLLLEKLNFNELDDNLSLAYKKYVFHYVKKIINDKKYSYISQSIKREMAELIFDENLYALKMDDINNIISNYLYVDAKKDFTAK